MRGPSEDSDYEELRPTLSVLLLVKITKVDQNLLRMKHGNAIAKESAPSEIFSFLMLQFVNCKIPKRGPRIVPYLIMRRVAAVSRCRKCVDVVTLE